MGVWWKMAVNFWPSVALGILALLLIAAFSRPRPSRNRRAFRLFRRRLP